MSIKEKVQRALQITDHEIQHNEEFLKKHLEDAMRMCGSDLYGCADRGLSSTVSSITECSTKIRCLKERRQMLESFLYEDDT